MSDAVQHRTFCLLGCYLERAKINLYKTILFIKKRTQTESVWEHDAEDNIWTKVTTGWRKLYKETLHNFQEILLE
jgi:hypothetical protein